MPTTKNILKTPEADYDCFSVARKDFDGFYTIYKDSTGDIKVKSGQIFYADGNLYQFNITENGWSIHMHHRISDYGNME